MVMIEILEIATNLMDSGLFKKFVMPEDRGKSNAFHDAFYPDAFNVLWTAIKFKLGVEDQKEILFSQNQFNSNFLMHATVLRNHQLQVLLLEATRPDLRMIQAFLSIIKKMFNCEEKLKFLLAEGLEHLTALNAAAKYGDLEVFTIIWNFIKYVLSRNDQKKMLLKNRTFGGNIFMLSFNREMPLKSMYNKTSNLCRERNS